MELLEPPLDLLLPRYSHTRAQYTLLYVLAHYHWDRPEVVLRETQADNYVAFDLAHMQCCLYLKCQYCQCVH